MADTSPLAEMIARYADQKMFDAIAREYQKGRLLMIGTTDLDAQRPVIWNIGAIAASGHPSAGSVPQDPARLGGDPRRLPAGADRRRDRRPQVSRKCMSTAARSPSSSSIRRRSICPTAACVAYGTPTSSAMPRSIRTTRERTAHHLDRRPRHQHHAGGERPQRRAAHLLRHPARRRRLQPRLYRVRISKHPRPASSTRSTCTRSTTTAISRPKAATPGTRRRPAFTPGEGRQEAASVRPRCPGLVIVTASQHVVPASQNRRLRRRLGRRTNRRIPCRCGSEVSFVECRCQPKKVNGAVP